MKVFALLFGFGACVLSTSMAIAGPLDPPAGPIASTGKTLSQIEPRIPLSAATTPGDSDSTFKITQPGSYYLTGNLQQIGSTNGIEIASSNVTIDLSGYTVAPTAPSGGGYGIIGSDPNLSNITIRNGIVSRWAVQGVRLSSTSRGHLVEGVTTQGNGGTGILVGDVSVVKDCVVSENGGDGIQVGFGGLVSGCVAGFNGGWGVRSLSSAVIENCTSHANGGGIYAGLRATVSGCLVSVSGIAIQCDGMATIIGCSLTQNDRGVDLAANSQILDTLVVQSLNGGIFAGDACTIRGNTVETSGSPDTPASGGIVVNGIGSRIEGNHMVSNYRGLVVNGSQNIIVRNTCRANSTNWVIAANNQYGPIVDRSTASTPAVNGNTAASTLTSTDANANFTY